GTSHHVYHTENRECSDSFHTNSFQLSTAVRTPAAIRHPALYVRITSNVRACPIGGRLLERWERTWQFTCSIESCDLDRFALALDSRQKAPTFVAALGARRRHAGRQGARNGSCGSLAPTCALD